MPQVTTLPNKLRVVTEGAPTYVHSLGVFIDGGTRFESARTSGVTHLLDKMAFKVDCLLLISPCDHKSDLFS